MHNEQRELEQALQHPLIVRLQERLLHLKPVDAEMYPESKLAAVVALLRVSGEKPDDVDILFIKRAVVARDPWSGHMAFPGGRHDVSDVSLEHTAIRETREEVAIDLAKLGHVLGRLDDLAPRSPSLPPIIVRPFVAVVAGSVSLSPNHEVADTFWIPLRDLSSDEARAEHLLERDGSTARFPAYSVQAQTVWGLTERIVSQLLPLLDR